MKINADFTQRVAIHSNDLPWQASPMAGVDRRMLDRIGDEVARATSIVRYAPKSEFSAHVHTGGEEFIVLDGVFQDEHGDWEEGYYIRNPPTSKHKPASEAGCSIFVKLWQFDLDDRSEVKINMNDLILEPDPETPSIKFAILHQDDRELVRLEEWSSGQRVLRDMPSGAELLILDGSFADGPDILGKHDWLRIPAGGKLDAVAGDTAARVWIKTGHLKNVQPPKF